MNDRDYEYTEDNLNILRPINDKYNNYDDENIEIINRILK